MKAIIVGKRHSKYTQKNTGEVKEGYEVYYNAPRQGTDGLSADTLWIPLTNRFYGLVKDLDVSRPVNAIVVNEIPPGARFPEMTEFEIVQPQGPGK